MKKELAELEAEVGWDQCMPVAHGGYGMNFNDESLLHGGHGGHDGRLWQCFLGVVAIVFV
jgi:hypothetical protein